MRDVIYSLMYKRRLSFDQLLRKGMIHQILANDLFWRSHPGVLVQRYEAIVDDPLTAVVQLARHLGVGVTRHEAAEIADEFSLESNQRRISALRGRLEQAGFDLDCCSGLDACDPVTLLHWNHLRPSGTGSWEVAATPWERTMMDRACGAWLRANGYAPTLLPVASPGTVPFRQRLNVPNQWSMALGQAAFLVRLAATRFPLAAEVARRLLRMDRPRPDRIVACSVS